MANSLRHSETLYRVWSNMKTRCNNSNCLDFDNYGGRGITVCKRWSEFDNFKADMINDYQPGLTLDRINTNGNYEPSNCRWATIHEQANNRRTNHMITIENITKNITQWIRTTNIKGSTVRQRYYVYGWSIEKSLGMEK